MEAKYLTSGQIARSLRVSISTLKRWVDDEGVLKNGARNANGWRLFTPNDLEQLREFKREKRRNGRQFQDTTLTPAKN